MTIEETVESPDIGESEKLYLPWHHNDNGLITGTPDDSKSETYPFIADLTQDFGIEGPGDKFRADFIVQACNAHHAMLATLEFIAGHARLAKSNYGPDDRQSITHRNRSFETIIKRAEDAIANAKEAAP